MSCSEGIAGKARQWICVEYSGWVKVIVNEERVPV